MRNDTKIICVIQARMGSTRLPGKSLKKLTGTPMLELIINNIIESRYISRYIVATSNSIKDDEIYNLCKKIEIDCYRGSEIDVLSRFEEVSKKYDADLIIRLTGDNPFVEKCLIDDIIDNYFKNFVGYDYVNNIDNSGYPYGLFIEIIGRAALDKLKNNINILDREHVTRYFRNNKDKFKTGVIKTDKKFKYTYLTVDNKKDFYNAENIMKEIINRKINYTYTDLIKE
jgi:spore coat polysaccharide biosynthesis protein SpsF